MTRHRDTGPMWFERRAHELSPGDFVRVDESDGPHSRIVRAVRPGGDGNVVVRWWDGTTDVERTLPANALIELA